MIVAPATARVLAAGNSNLVLLPAYQTVSNNGTFDIAIQIQANGDPVGGVQVYLDFDPTKLAVNSITPVTAWNGKSVVVLERSFDDVAGYVAFSAGILGGSTTGTFTIATINFISKASTANTSISFHFNPYDLVRNTAIAAGGTSNMLLNTTTGAGVTVTGGSPTAPQLVSLAVTPAASSIAAGQTQQFTVNATYSDKSNANITSIVTWTSSNQAVATIDTAGKASPGMATALVPGTATITAAVGTLSSTSTLTVSKAVEDQPVTSPPDQNPVTPTPTSPATTTPSQPGETTPAPSVPAGETPSAPAPTGESPAAPAPAGGTPTTPVPAGETNTTNAPPAASTTAINWGLFGGIAGGVIVLGLGSYLLLRSRM